MKKFNKKTLIISLLIFAGVVALVFTTFAQTWVGPKDLNPPQNLTAEVQDENDVNLIWNAPSTGDSTYLHWDNGINYTSFGNFLQPVVMDYVAKWDPDHITNYDGWTITKMRFYVTVPMPTIKIIIMTGPDATEIYSQDVPNFNVNSWTEITLDMPIAIDASTQLWAGLNIDMPITGPVMGCDEGPAVSGYGDLYRFNNVWDNSGLNWNIQILIEEPELPVLLHWDNGENFTSYGNVLQPVQIDYATKWDPDHIEAYDGWTVTKMRFYLTNPMPTVKLKIWTGTEPIEIYSQDVPTFSVNDWTEIDLDSPVTIDANSQFWIGLNIDMPSTGTVMGCDEGPAIDDYGNIYRFNGGWYSDLNNNWNIQFQVENIGSKEVDGLLGYNVYRNDELINDNTLGGIAYIDENMLNGTYSYYITAVYDEGESDPSNTVEVIIAQPVIAYADSMALVDLYNNCNGPNWIGNDLWLEGPVSEWHGVATTDTRVTKLWRQSNNLIGDIPESIGDLTALQELHLEANQITSIPENIGNLLALKEFWLGWNPLVFVPESIGNLINLEQLHLGSMDTPLGTLPDNFCNLESLNWLALGGAGLNSLPDNFGNLTALENCFLWGNNLTELPAGFGGCESMAYLTIDDNQLTSLPESFGDMSNLHYLNIESNQLTSLPESFGNLNSLHTLSSSQNELNSLPESFGNLNNLSFLNFISNQLASLSENFGSLSSLDSVYLEYNQLTELPASFGNLSDLNLLGLEYNQLTELPASFGNLATVEKIYLNENQLQVLPENFGNMPELLLLVLVNNNLISLPESITDLTNLQYLYAGGNQLQSLPATIGNMVGLDILAADFNNIAEIPESIIDLSNMSYLNLNHNDIINLPELFGSLNADTVLLGNNDITELPLSMFNNYYDVLWVQDNALQFGSIEPLMGQVLEFQYDSQALIGNDTIVEVVNNTSFSYTIDVTGDNNIYKWYKDGALLMDQTSNSLYIENASFDDQGTYVLNVTNSSVPILELVSYDIEMSIITGLSDVVVEDFSMYPNPVSGNLINVLIDVPAEVEGLIIINGSGQVVRSEKITSENSSIDIGDLTEGIYIVKVVYINGSFQIEKLIVK